MVPTTMSFRGSEATAPQGGLSCPFGAIHLLGISWNYASALFAPVVNGTTPHLEIAASALYGPPRNDILLGDLHLVNNNLPQQRSPAEAGDLPIRPYTFFWSPFRPGYDVPFCLDPKPSAPEHTVLDYTLAAVAVNPYERWILIFQSDLRRHAQLRRFRSCTQPIRRLFAQLYRSLASLRCCVLTHLMRCQGRVCRAYINFTISAEKTAGHLCSVGI